MWSTLFLTKIVKLSRATTAVKTTNTATQNSPTKKHSFFSPAHLRFLRQMLLPNMRPVRITNQLCQTTDAYTTMEKSYRKNSANYGLR